MISQSQIKNLLKDRLQKPEKYKNIPLIIWRANLNDGLQMPALLDVLKEFNQGKDKESGKWYAVDPKRPVKDNVALCLFSFEKDYSELLSNRKEAPIILFAPFPAPNEDVLNDFPNAEQYIFQPSFDEFEQYVKKALGIPNFLIDFIKEGSETDIPDPYRWYNFFNAGYNRTLKPLAERENTGCDYPESWLKVLKKLKMARSFKEKREKRKIKFNEISPDYFHACFSNDISEDLKEEFRNFLKDKNL